MMEHDLVQTYISRYLIPFYFEYEDNGYSRITTLFKDTKKNYKELGMPQDCKWHERGFWEKKNKQPEMDIYTYLTEILKEQPEGVNESNLGTSFVLDTSGDILNLKYVDKGKKIDTEFKINNLGILFFRNGIGFIWYEISFNKKGISLEEYINFQNSFKELARTYGNKIKKRVCFNKHIEFEDFCLGEFLVKLLDTQALGIRFWAERKIKNQEIVIPDKALLFQYLFLDNVEKQNAMDLAFHVANGYDKKYTSPLNLREEIYEPFGNGCFYISKSGFSYVVSGGQSNGEFFKSSFPNKFCVDYFFIYVLLLYQTYASAHYSRLLTKIPADVALLENKEENIKRLRDLAAQINLFLVKTVYESVSNIHHQNSVYLYGKKMLHIDQDMNGLTAGLTALHGMEQERQIRNEELQKSILKKERQRMAELQEKKDRKLNNAAIVFGMLVVVSAVLDALSLVDWFVNNKMGIFHIFVVVVVMCLTVYMIWAFVRNTRINNKKGEE